MSDLGLFEDLDVNEEVPEVPDKGTHLFTLRNSDVSFAPWDQRKYLVMRYILTEEGHTFNGFSFNKRFWLPSKEEFEEDRSEATRAVNKYKVWMRSHNVPEEELSNPDLESLTGIQVLIYGGPFDTQTGTRWVGQNARIAEQT